MDWSDKETVEQRLKSHLIPFDEINSSSYDSLDIEEKKVKLEKDFNDFLEKRAQLIYSSALILCDGQQLSYSKIEEIYKREFDY